MGGVYEFLTEIAALWRPHRGQRAFLLAKAPYRALACGRRWGKTDVCAVEVAYRLHGTKPGRAERGTTLLVAPTMEQARILFDRTLDLLHDLAERDPLRFPMPRLRGGSYPRLDLGNRRVLARSANRPRSLRGLGADHIVVDEAAYVPSGLLAEVLFPMLATSRRGTVTLLSTPSGFGEFQRFYERGAEGQSRYWSRTAPTAENPRVTGAFLDHMRETTPEATYAREYEGRFAGTEGGLFAFEAVRRAVSSEPLVAGNGPFAAGLDLARTRDWTALVVLEGTREGAKAVHVDRWRGLGWQRQLERVRATLEAFPGVALRLDGTGLGDPVLEWARRLMPETAIQGTVFDRPTKRSLTDGVVYLLEQGVLRLPDRRDLTDELLAFVERPNGRVEGSGAHDDLVCALALAAASLPGVGGGIYEGRAR